MKTRHAVDAFRVQVDGSKPHSHLMAVGTVTCDEHGKRTTGAVTLRNVDQEGEACAFHNSLLVVRRILCPVCHEPILSITTKDFEAKLPEGRVGEQAESPC